LFEEFGVSPPEKMDEIYKSFIDDHDALEMLLEERPAIVSFHFGLPTEEHIKALQDVGICTFATATNLYEATLIEKAGIDVIVAQGIEAGGHRGIFDPQLADEGLSTSVLIRLLVKQSRLPVIAAGGIMDGSGIKAARDLGAIAAQLGTAFVLCPESAANPGYRENLKSSRAKITRLTSTISGRPARGIINRFISHAESNTAISPAAYPVAYDAAKRLNAAAAKHGNHEFAAHWAGQGAPLAREAPAAELFQILMDEYRN
jgi:nitronate monooxygenase